MCNAVCVGIGQFLAPIIFAVAIVAIVGAGLSAIGRNIAEGNNERRRVRAYEEAQRARLGKDWRKALKEEELARLTGEISLARGQRDFDFEHYRAELVAASFKMHWGWTTAEIDERVEFARKRHDVPFRRAQVERLERQAAAIK
jgi:hypothetical protein